MKKLLFNTNMIAIVLVIAFVSPGCAEARYRQDNRLHKPDFGTRYNHDQPSDVGMGIKIYN
jgi:hypothetical protein